jgi:hypothetical protein
MMSALRSARPLAAWAALALGLVLVPRAAEATSCMDVARGGSSKRPACPLVVPKLLPPTRATARSRGLTGLGPVRTEEIVPRAPSAPPMPSGNLGNKRSTVEGDLAARDCHGSLCGPQSFTLRPGLVAFERAPSFSPMIGGLGAVAGAIALNLKPGPRPDAAPGANLDGWSPAPRGLKKSGPPFAFLPLISINNREGGAQFILSF